MPRSTSSEPLELSQSAVRVLASCAAAAGLCPELEFEDRVAERLFAHMNEGNVFFPEEQLRGTAHQAVALDDLLRERVSRLGSETLVVGMAPVLSTRAHRLPEVRWVDVDVPGIAALRRRLLPKRSQWTQLSAESLDRDWLEAVLAVARRPFILIMDEAWLPVDPEQLSALMEYVCQRAPAGSELLLAFDESSPIGRAQGTHAAPALDVRLGPVAIARFPRLRFVDSNDSCGRAIRGTRHLAAIAHLTVV